MHVSVSVSVSCMSMWHTMWPAPQAYAADVFGSPCSKEWKEGPAGWCPGHSEAPPFAYFKSSCASWRFLGGR